MLFYTAYGEQSAGEYASVAQGTGLERYLGYRPVFCSLIDPNSLTDTWFRIFSASPSFSRYIDVYEVEAEQAMPMDVVAWCERFLVPGGVKTTDDAAFAAILNNKHPQATDYLLHPDLVPSRRWHFNVADILCGGFDGFDLSISEQAALIHSMECVRVLPSKHPELVHFLPDEGPTRLRLRTWYRVMVAGGLVPFVWAQVTGRSLAPELLSVDPWELMRTPGYQRASNGIVAWYRSLGVPGAFSYGEYEAMRRSFVDACDQLAHHIVEEKAAALNQSRNGACFCASGLKFKKCCMSKGLDALACDWVQ